MKNLLILLLIGCILNASEYKVSFSNISSKIGKEPLVLEIGSSSCKTCVEMKKIISEIKTSNPKAPLYIIDIYDDKRVISYFNIKMIPTQIVYNKTGKEIYRHIGGLRNNDMLKLIELSNK